MHLRIFILLIVVMSIDSMSSPVTYIEDWNSPEIQKKWESYGAYYELDECIFEIHTSGSKSVPFSKVYINKRIKILTKEGTDFGTIAIRKYSNSIESFRCSVRDSLNSEVPLNQYQLKEEYLSNNEIVFPNVTAGSIIEIRIVFNIYSRPESYEHYFKSANLPVYCGRFVIDYPKNVEYDFKFYGKNDSTFNSNYRNRQYHEWICRKLIPVNRFLSASSDNIRPYIALSLRKWYSKKELTDWKKVAEANKNNYNGLFKRHVAGNVRTLFETIKNSSSESLLHEQILQWVKEEITWEDYYNPNESLSEIIKNRKAGTIGITRLLYKLYTHAGYETDIIVTRDIASGGFDPLFVTASSTTIPLVSISVNGSEKIVYPYASGSFVGDYPDDFFNQSGVSLKRYNVKNLPPPNDTIQEITNIFTIDIRNGTLDNKISIMYEGYAAFMIRNLLLHQSESDVRELFQNQLTNAGTGNALRTFSISGLTETGKTVIVNIGFDNDNVSIFRENGVQISTGYLFKPFFDEYDTLRLSSFAIPYSKKIKHKVTILVDPNNQIHHTIPSFQLENRLFNAECDVSVNNDTISLNLSLNVNRCELSPVQMKEIYNDILKLREFEKSTVSVIKKNVSVIKNQKVNKKNKKSL